MLTEDQIKRVRAKRHDDPYLTATYAVQQVRYEDAEPTEYPFLAHFDNYICPDANRPQARGTHNGVDVSVFIEYDEDSMLGDDDVTGTFVDKHEDGCIKNTVHYHSYGQNGQNREWYRPSNYRLEYPLDCPKGMSKGVAREWQAKVIRDEMQEDADRNYYLVHVVLKLRGITIGESYLGGVDATDELIGRAYLMEAAAQQIDEAFAEAESSIDKQIEEAKVRVKKLRKLRKRLRRN